VETPTGRQLVGYNFDWAGIKTSLFRGGVKDLDSPGSALVIGAGGTSRAAIYAFHAMKYQTIYIVNRSADKLTSIIDSFPKEFNIVPISSAEQARAVYPRPVAAVGAIPGDSPVTPELEEILSELLRGEGKGRVMAEMAYKPQRTPLMELAKRFGWRTVPGLEALTGQGVKQFELFTGGILPDYEQARKAVLGD